MTPADILRAAKARIATPERWTRGTMARDEDGNGVASVSDHACAWCSLGAMEAEAGASTRARVYAIRALNRAIDNKPIDDWNDAPGRTHAEVLAAFDRAIAIAEAP